MRVIEARENDPDRAASMPRKGRRAMFRDGLFAGKRILVTGGGTGLGKAMA